MARIIDPIASGNHYLLFNIEPLSIKCANTVSLEGSFVKQIESYQQSYSRHMIPFRPLESKKEKVNYSLCFFFLQIKKQAKKRRRDSYQQHDVRFTGPIVL